MNIRHRSILHRMLRAGLRKDHAVLEIGCGVGTLTSLVARKVRQGSLLSVDISPHAIALARKRFQGNDRVSFLVSDMSDFSVDRKFDFIILPDVLEHIPEEQHEGLFATLAGHLAPGGVIAIHIPDPFCLMWLHKERPEALQIVDQPLAILPMAERFARHGLLLDRYERYGLWTREPDYDWIEFRRAPELGQTGWPRWRAILNEVASRLGVW